MFVNVGDFKMFVRAPRDHKGLMGMMCADWNKLGVWTLPATPAGARRLVRLGQKTGEEIIWSDSTKTRRLIEWTERWELSQRFKVAEECPRVPLEGGPESWKHQIPGFWSMYHMAGGILSAGVGTGKSKVIINLIQNRKHKRTLILTTPSAVDDWPIHFKKHCAIDCCLLALDESYGSCDDKMRAIEEQWDKHEYLIVALSYQSMIRHPLGPVVDTRGRWMSNGYLFNKQWDFVVADEIQKISSAGGKTSNVMYRIGLKTPYRLGASGTIIKHKPEDLYGVFRFIDPAIVGTRYDRFAERYCIYNVEHHNVRCAEEKARAEIENRPCIEPVKIPRFVVDYKRLDELGAILAAVSFHVDSKVLNLPIPIHDVKRCELSVAARRAYEEMAEEAITVLESGETAESVNCLSKLLRLEQITSGFIGGLTTDANGDLIDDPKQVTQIDTAKYDLLVETLQSIDTDEPVTVFCRWRHDLKSVQKAAKECRREYFEQSGKKKQKREFLESTGGAVLGGQVQSVSEAIDLTKCRYAVVMSIGFSLFLYEQMIGRLNRPGQMVQPTFIHLIASGTVDEKKYAALQARKDVVKYIIEAGARSLRYVSASKRQHAETLFAIAE